MAEYPMVLIAGFLLSPNVRLLRFRTVSGQAVPFLAGQWFTFYVQTPEGEIARDYSIAGRHGNDIEIAVTRVLGGTTSNALHELVEGASVRIKGPEGFFTHDHVGPSLYVATGTGVAPIRAMMQADGSTQNTLLFGARSEDDILFAAEWRSEQTLRFLPTLTQATSTWKGLRGRVQEHLSAELVADRHVYVCGVRKMVDEVRIKLKALGLPRQRIHSERFD